MVLLTAGLSSAANKHSIVFVWNMVILAAFGDVLVMFEGRSLPQRVWIVFFLLLSWLGYSLLWKSLGRKRP